MQIVLLVGSPGIRPRRMNEADEAKVEKERFCWRRGWVGSVEVLRVARRAVKLCLEWPS